MTHAPDNPSLDLLARYLRGDVSGDDRRRVDAWLAADPTRATELEDLRRLLAAAGPDRAEWDLDRLWGSIESWMRMAPAEAPKPRLVAPARRSAPRFMLTPTRRWPAAARAAAAVLVVGAGTAAAALLGPSLSDREPIAPPTVMSTTRAQRLSVRLADNTLVILAPESRLEIAPVYGKRERRVRLEGEAAFTVEHDEARPFAVETRRAVARDLGTRFVVRAYAADPATEVIVAEGVVAFARPGGHGADSLLVTPGELARVTDDGRLSVTSGVAVDRYFAWTADRLVFENTPLAEVAAQLERWYDVEIRLASPEFRTRRVTASFQRERPEDVLRLVAALLGLEVKAGRGGQVYTLRARSSS